MMPIRIIGIGSPFGDDQLGWHAVTAIRRSGLLNHVPEGTVSTHICDRPGSGLLALMEGASHVILIDAMRSDATPGGVRRLEKEDITPSAGLLSSHGLGVASALALGEVLGVLPRQWVCYGVELGQLVTDTLSPTVALALPLLLEKISAELHGYIGEA